MLFAYVLIANGAVKMFYRKDELSDAIEAYLYTRKFYHDCTLNMMKYSLEKHSIELVECKIDKEEKDVYSYSGQ